MILLSFSILQRDMLTSKYQHTYSWTGDVYLAGSTTVWCYIINWIPSHDRKLCVSGLWCYGFVRLLILICGFAKSDTWHTVSTTHIGNKRFRYHHWMLSAVPIFSFMYHLKKEKERKRKLTCILYPLNGSMSLPILNTYFFRKSTYVYACYISVVSMLQGRPNNTSAGRK